MSHSSKSFLRTLTKSFLDVLVGSSLISVMVTAFLGAFALSAQKSQFLSSSSFKKRVAPMVKMKLRISSMPYTSKGGFSGMFSVVGGIVESLIPVSALLFFSVRAHSPHHKAYLA